MARAAAPVLIGYDGSEVSRAAVRHAAELFACLQHSHRPPTYDRIGRETVVGPKRLQFNGSVKAVFRYSARKVQAVALAALNAVAATRLGALCAQVRAVSSSP
jgi:hypothetical protein